MGNSFRVDRVGMEIKREVNEILQKKVRDPRVQDVTITDVQMLDDLSAAKIFYTIHSTLASDNQKAQTGLEKATGTIKRELGKKLTMYKIPDLTFFIKDEFIEYLVIKLMKCFVIWSVKTKKNSVSYGRNFALKILE